MGTFSDFVDSTVSAQTTFVDTDQIVFTRGGLPYRITGADFAAGAAFSAAWGAAQLVNAQTGTTYTPVAADMGKLVTLSNAAAITLTIPQDSALTAWTIGKVIDFLQLGAGQVTATAGTGATLRTSGLTNKA